MKRYSFQAIIHRSTGWGAFVYFPHSAYAEFSIAGRVPVQALVAGVPYTGSLMPQSGGVHRLAVPIAVLKQSGKAPGDTIQISLHLDSQQRTVELPEDLSAALRESGLLPAFEKLSITRRKEYRNWILSAKRADTRARRGQKAVDMLRNETGSTK